LTGTIGKLVFLAALLSLRAQTSLFDSSFQPGAGPDDSVAAVSVQPDGKVLIAGAFTHFNTVASGRIARLNPDGALDVTFAPGEGADGAIYRMVVQPDGRILVAGDFTHLAGAELHRIGRLNSDGSLDESFAPNGGAEQAVSVHGAGIYALSLQPNGQILVGGGFGQFNGVARRQLARLNGDGALDEAFAPDTQTDDLVMAVAPLPNGKTLVGGRFVFFNGQVRPSLARLNPDGTPDDSFASPLGLGSAVFDILAQSDGQALVAGYFNVLTDGASRTASLVRLLADGALDQAFDAGIGFGGGYEPVFSVALQPDGKALVGGGFQFVNGFSRPGIARLLQNGALDSCFVPTEGVSGDSGGFLMPAVRAVAVQADGRLVVGGAFTRLEGVDCNHLARMLPDSGCAPGVVQLFPLLYGVQESATNAVVSVVRAGDPEKLVTVEYCTSDLVASGGTDYAPTAGVLAFARGQSRANILIPILDDREVEWAESFALVLTNAVGAILTSNRVATISILDDDCGVEFAGLSGQADEMTRTVALTVECLGPQRQPVSVDYFTSDGSAVAGLDYEFKSGTLRFSPGQRTNVIEISLRDDPLVEGPEWFLVTLTNASGAVVLEASRQARIEIADNDTESGPGRGANDAVGAVTALADGGAYISGPFQFVDGQPRRFLAKLKSDGVVDPAYNLEPGLDAPANAMLALADGRLLIGGSFTNVNGVPRRGLARLRAEGALDETFQPGAGISGPVLYSDPESRLTYFKPAVDTLGMQSDGRLLAGGLFTNFNGIACEFLVRLRPDGSVDEPFVARAGLSSPSFRVLVQSDDRILLVGNFRRFKGQSCAGLARLLPEGDLDPSYRPQVDIRDYPVAAVLQPDGRLVIAGNISFPAGEFLRPQVVRLEPDGTPDVAFNANAALAGALAKYFPVVAAEPGGGLLLVGPSYGDLWRFLPDGRRDLSFAPQFGFHGGVAAVAACPAGGLFVGGHFVTVNGAPRRNVARLDPAGQIFELPRLLLPVELLQGQFYAGVNLPVGGRFVVEASPDFRSWTVVLTNTGPAGRTAWVDTRAGQFVRRFYRVRQ
jgi:uncharacterized delta-60 repeat protein